MMMKLSWSLLFLSLAWWINQSSKTREISCNSDYNDFIIIQTDSRCSLQLTPRIQNVGITINCGGQCGIVSSFMYSHCVDLFDELGIQRCIQAECNTRIYNLSITRENEITTSDMPIQSNAMDDVTNDMTTEKIQANIPITVHRLDSTNRYVMDKCNGNTNQQSTAIAVLATMVAILIVLLVIVSTVLIWTCWTFNHKFQQHR